MPAEMHHPGSHGHVRSALMLCLPCPVPACACTAATGIHRPRLNRSVLPLPLSYEPAHTQLRRLDCKRCCLDKFGQVLRLLEVRSFLVRWGKVPRLAHPDFFVSEGGLDARGYSPCTVQGDWPVRRTNQIEGCSASNNIEKENK